MPRNKNLLATGYYGGIRKVKGKYHIYPEQSVAGLWSNPTDYAKYVIETQLSVEGKSEKVFSQEETKFRLTPFMNSEAALGEFIDNERWNENILFIVAKMKGFCPFI